MKPESFLERPAVLAGLVDTPRPVVRETSVPRGRRSFVVGIAAHIPHVQVAWCGCGRRAKFAVLAAATP